MNIINNKGPKIEPCGTPKSMGNIDEFSFPNLTNCVREDKYDLKSCNVFPSIPYLGSLRNKTLWSTESKALARSKKNSTRT